MHEISLAVLDREQSQEGSGCWHPVHFCIPTFDHYGHTWIPYCCSIRRGEPKVSCRAKSSLVFDHRRYSNHHSSAMQNWTSTHHTSHQIQVPSGQRTLLWVQLQLSLRCCDYGDHGDVVSNCVMVGSQTQAWPGDTLLCTWWAESQQL